MEDENEGESGEVSEVKTEHELKRKETKRNVTRSRDGWERVCIWCTSYLNMLSARFIVRK